MAPVAAQSYSRSTELTMAAKLGLARASGALAFALLSSCGGDTASPDGPQADLRLLHASSSLGALDLSVGDQTLISNVAFGTSSPIVRVPAGEQHITVRAGGTVVGGLDVQLSTDHVNAVVVAGGVPQFSSDVVPDTGAVNPARANLRLVNVATGNSAAPTQLQVLLNFPGVSADSTAKFGGYDATVARYWSLLYFDPGHFRIRYVPQGTTTVLAEAEFDIAAGETKAAVLRRLDDGSYQVEIVKEE
jgi:hypothetical protein